MANKIERDNMNSPCFDEILPGDLHFLLPFQIANNVIDYKISWNVKFEPTSVALVPP